MKTKQVKTLCRQPTWRTLKQTKYGDVLHSPAESIPEGTLMFVRGTLISESSKIYLLEHEDGRKVYAYTDEVEEIL